MGNQPAKQDRKGIAQAQDEALRRSRGGLSTKLHLRTDGGGKPLVILATAGQRHEVTQLGRLLDQGAVKRTSTGGRPGRRQGLQLLKRACRASASWHPGGDPDQVQPAAPSPL
jgi:hypothetical protein